MSFNHPDTLLLLNQAQHDRLLEEARWQRMLRPLSTGRVSLWSRITRYVQSVRLLSIAPVIAPPCPECEPA